MDRKLWERKCFTHDDGINYPCPQCSSRLDFIHHRTEVTTSGIELEELGYPYGIEHIFSSILKCSSCSKVISVGGLCEKDYQDGQESPTGEYELKYVTFYFPKFFYPNLRMIPLSSEISTEVREQIDLSFSCFFSDLSSAANRIRNAIELILDDVKAPKFKITRRNTRHFFKSLHNRIENFKKQKKIFSELLLAIKFIGNEGSHIGNIELEDILDAYQILDEIIEIAYVKNRKKTHQIAKEINSLKKPRSKKE